MSKRHKNLFYKIYTKDDKNGPVSLKLNHNFIELSYFLSHSSQGEGGLNNKKCHTTLMQENNLDIEKPKDIKVRK